MKSKIRKSLDLLMAVFMIALMSYQATGNLFHEAAGVMLMLLFLIHNILNRKWYRAIPKGKYSFYRGALLAVNIFVLFCMLTAMGTGIYLSQTVFAPLLGMREAYLIRPWHVAAGAWGTVFVSVHGGMHIRIPKEKKGKVFVMTGGGFLAAAGLWAFFAMDMPDRMMVRDAGMYWRYSKELLFGANAVVMAFFTAVGAFLGTYLKKKGRSK